MFQIPLGPWPYKLSTRLWSRSRTWWGIGTVVTVPGGYFAVRFTYKGQVSLWRYSEAGFKELDLTTESPEMFECEDPLKAGLGYLLENWEKPR